MPEKQRKHRKPAAQAMQKGNAKGTTQAAHSAL